MKSIFIVVIVAIAAYFLFRPTTFTVKNDIFMYKLPEDVYEFLSDLKRTVEKHSVGGKCSLVKQRTRFDGVKEKLYLLEKDIPLVWDYKFPFNMEIRLTLSKPNEELQYNFGFFRGYLLKVHSRMTFEQREGRVMKGTFLMENLTVTCPWLAQTLVEKNLKESHKDTLISLRNGLEGLPVATEKTQERMQEAQDKKKKTKTEKKKKEAGTTDKKEKGTKKDGGKKSSGQEKKGSEQVKTKAAKEEKKQTVDKKTEKERAKDADAEPRRAEKAPKTSRQEKTETRSKDKSTTDEKTGRKATQDAEVKPKQSEGEKVKKAEARQEEHIAKDIKKEKVPRGDGSKEKDAGKTKQERIKVEKQGSTKDAKEAKSERKIEETVQKQSESKKDKRDGAKPETVKESETRGQKPQVPKAEKKKIVNPVKSEQEQGSRVGVKGQRSKVSS